VTLSPCPDPNAVCPISHYSRGTLDLCASRCAPAYPNRSQTLCDPHRLNDRRRTAYYLKTDLFCSLHSGIPSPVPAHYKTSLELFSPNFSVICCVLFDVLTLLRISHGIEDPLETLSAAGLKICSRDFFDFVCGLTNRVRFLHSCY
jgi:hypothetical protein